MNKTQLKTLTTLNLLYVNPSYTLQSRKKGKRGKKLIQAIVSQYVLSGIIFLVVYGMTMVFMDFSKLPGYFTYYMGLFGVIGFSQSMSAIFNVFFESRDLKDYLPLPFRQGEVFFAKFIVVGMTIIPFLLPLLILFFLTAWRSGIVLPLAVLSALVLFLAFFLVLFGACSILIFKLTQTKSFLRHKKLFTTLMLVISTIVMFVGIMLMSHNQAVVGEKIVDRPVLHLFWPFYQLAHAPLSLAGLACLAGLLVLLGGLFLILKAVIVPKLYVQFGDEANQVPQKKRRVKGEQSFKRQLFNYNFQLIKNPNLIMQVATSSLLLPIVFLATMFSTGGFHLNQLGSEYFGVFFLGGLVFADLLLNPASLVSNLISLDRENFAFIKSLPLSLRTYLKNKFWFGCGIQMFLAGGLALIASLAFRLPLLLTGMYLIGTLWGTYLFSLYFFARDYRLLDLTWTNVSQLFTRGGGNFGLMLWMFVSLVIGGALIVLYAVGVYFKVNAWLLNGGVLLWLFIMAGAWLYINHISFWKRLEK
ncbi:ABC transporter [Enterococcus sp. CSURQ0835]|uniref:ABC transporter n=1 Tax=Enterococcus sp. CSURQ0835 TaxID=2681394 RepID=UPI00135ACDF0|nr:ABC transporter [Enterococcus sp. CSURQ0835]